MLRFDQAVIAEKPDLVLWQLAQLAGITCSIAARRSAPASTGCCAGSTSLMDPQYAPKVIAKPEAAQMVERSPAPPGRERRSVSPLEVMQRWHEVDPWRSTPSGARWSA
jgi:hypothetical protein